MQAPSPQIALKARIPLMGALAGRAKQAGKRVCKTFSSSAWHFSFAQHLLPLKCFDVANSAVPHSITTAHIDSVGSQPRQRAFCKALVCVPFLLPFLFISYRPTCVPASWSVPTTTHPNHTSQPRRRRPGPLNPYPPRTHPLRKGCQRNKTLKRVASTLVLPLFGRGVFFIKKNPPLQANCHGRRRTS
jgi:hypothetical protein